MKPMTRAWAEGFMRGYTVAKTMDEAYAAAQDAWEKYAEREASIQKTLDEKFPREAK